MQEKRRIKLENILDYDRFLMPESSEGGVIYGFRRSDLDRYIEQSMIRPMGLR